MIFLIILSIIIGAIVAGITGIGILFWVVAGGIFILGLPCAIISGIFDFIHRENEYSQDRADYRELMRQIDDEEHMDSYLDTLDYLNNGSDVFIDNRQIHFHNTIINNSIDDKKSIED